MIKKVVLITGCSTGIGRELAKQFHFAGFTVTATARKVETLDPLQIKGIRTLPLDVTDSKAIENVISTITTEEGQLDVLINNAGYGLMGPLIELNEEDISNQFKTNVFAPLLIAQKAAPLMKKQGHGQIYNIGSVSGITTTPYSGAYSASKAALHSISDALRMELSPFGIQVITVQTGGIKSNFGDNADAITSKLLKPNSWYKKVEDVIKMRAKLSQENATPVERFAQKIVDSALMNHPPKVIKTGKKSTLLPFLKQWLPTTILDKIMVNKFGLNRL